MDVGVPIRELVRRGVQKTNISRGDEKNGRGQVSLEMHILVTAAYGLTMIRVLLRTVPLDMRGRGIT